MHDIIGTGITSLVKLSEAWIVILLFHVCKTNLGASIEMFGSFVSINSIASKPLVESHGAHNVVVRHRIKAVKCVLDFLLRADSCLEGRGTSSG